MNRILSAILALAPCLVASGAEQAPPAAADNPAELLAGVFGDHMVLQRGMAVPVWGKCDPGASVTVKFTNQTKTAKADETGRWRVSLDKMEAVAEGQELSVTDGKQTRTLRDVLVGEVWLCSGQSNMELSLAYVDRRAPASVNDPGIRHLKVPVTALSEPRERMNASWTVCTPQSAGEYTAAGYYMARHLRKELKVPVGLIHASLGGSKIEAWIPASGYRDIPALAAINRDVEATIAAMREGRDKPKPFAKRHEPKLHPTTLYNGMIHPLVGYAMRGATWYQGEANRQDGMLYVEKMKALIGGWRALWGIGEFPVYFVQITPYRYPPDPKNRKGDADPTMLARFWAAQSASAAAIPHTAMIVTNDIGNVRDAHPRNKRDVGLRLALLALHHTYGRKDLVCSGPVYKGFSAEGGRIRVTFDHAEGLKAHDGKPLSWFEVRGDVGDWVKAEAVIDGETVLVSSAEIPRPAHVRFAWSKMAEPNLSNGAGLPTAAFNTAPDALLKPGKASGD